MRRSLLAAIAIAILLVLGGVTSSVAKDHWFSGWGNSHGICGSGVATTVDRKVDGFDQIEISLGADLDITVGPQFKVTMTCDDNLIDLITTRVRRSHP